MLRDSPLATALVSRLIRMMLPGRFFISLPFLALVSAIALSGCASKEERIAKTLRKADEAVLKDDGERVVAILVKGAAKHPESAEVREALGQAYLRTNQSESALEAYRKAIELDDSKRRHWVTVANLHKELGQTAEAAAAYQTYLESYPDDFLAWKNLAFLQDLQGNRAAAIEAAFTWYELRPSAAAPAMFLGELFHEGRNIPQARSWYSQAAAYENDPDSKSALAKLIELEVGLKQFVSAETWLKQYGERFGEDLRNPRIQAAADAIEQWHAAQKQIAMEATRLERERRQLEAERAKALAAEERAREEREAAIPQEQTEEQVEVATENLGVPLRYPSNEESVKPPAQLADAGEAIPTDSGEASTPQTENSAMEKAREASDAGDFPTAIEHYWNALGQESDNAEIWLQLARVYEKQSSWQDAEACILEARRRDSQSPEIAQSYLDIAKYTQPPRRAIEESAQLRSQFPEHAGIALAHAQTLLHAESSASSVERAYRAFLELADSSSPGYNEARSYLSGH